jgi:hypothetical protein
MTVHSDSDLGILLALLALFVAGMFFVVACILLLERNFRAAIKVSLMAVAGLIALPLFVGIVAVLMPQTIVKLGDSYCMDINCIRIDKVEKETRETDAVYTLDVRLFSEANTVKTSLGAVSLFLQDERGRRFLLLDDPSVIPYDTYLDPGQTINTRLTFKVPADAKELFLTEGPRIPASAAKRSSLGGKSPPFWAPLAGVWFYLASFGNDAHPLHKPTMMRVL